MRVPTAPIFDGRPALFEGVRDVDTIVVDQSRLHKRGRNLPRPIDGLRSFGRCVTDQPRGLRFAIGPRSCLDVASDRHVSNLARKGPPLMERVGGSVCLPYTLWLICHHLTGRVTSVTRATISTVFPSSACRSVSTTIGL